MKDLTVFLNTLKDAEKKERLSAVFRHISRKFPELTEEIRWNQPMYTHHGTFIIGFSVAKHHMAIAPEVDALEYFQESIKNAGYQRTKMLFKIQWTQPIDYNLLDEIIAYNIKEKRETTKFWR